MFNRLFFYVPRFRKITGGTWLIVFSLIFFFVFNVRTGAAAQRSSAKIKFLVGNVKIMQKGKIHWKTAHFNDRVYQGDRIRTELSSRVELEMPDGSVIKINENSMFDVKEIKTPKNEHADKMSFTLWVGSIFAKFQKIVEQRQSRVIESPSAVVAVRGTQFDLSVDRDQTTTVRVYEGRVSFRSKQAPGEVFVSSNQESKVEKGKPPQPPKPFKPRRGASMGDRLPSGQLLKINMSKFQFTDPVILTSGLPIRGRTIPGAQVIANGQPLNVGSSGVFTGRVPVVEGLNVINVIAELKGKKQKQTVRIFINTQKPQIKLARPLTNMYTNRRDYSLSGAVFDRTPGDRVKLYINDELVTEVMGQGSFNRTIILNEGKNTIRVVAEDLSGNRTVHVEQIFLDTVKPILTVTEPAQTVYVRFEPPRPPNEHTQFAQERFRQVIRGIVIDPQPSSGIKRVLVNGQEIKPNNDGSFEATIFVKRAAAGRRGENRLSFIVEDMAGNILRDNSRVIIIQ
jgi:hypothetical protein